MGAPRRRPPAAVPRDAARPEPLGASFSAARLAPLAAGRRAPVKAFLLDQRRLAGIGNIYADEALWRARIHPRRPAGELDPARSRGCTARPGGAPARRRAPGLDAARVRHAGRRRRRDAARVPRLRPSRRAVRPLRQRRSSGSSSAAAGRGSARAASGSEPRPAARTLEPWPARRSPRPSCSARSLRRGRPGAAPLHRRERPARCDGEGRPPDEEPVRWPPRAVLARRARLHRGRGELGTVTGASLVRSHDRIRSDGYRLQVGLVGLEAMLRLFTEEERNDRAFLALTRFLDALDEREPQPGAGRRSTRSSSRSSSSSSGCPGFLRTSRRVRRVRGGGGARRVRRGRRAGAVVRGSATAADVASSSSPGGLRSALGGAARGADRRRSAAVSLGDRARAFATPSRS